MRNGSSFVDDVLMRIARVANVRAEALETSGGCWTAAQARAKRRSDPDERLRHGVPNAMRGELEVYYAAFCSFCDQGTIGLRWCVSGTGRRLVLLCDECELTWTSPQVLAAGAGTSVSSTSDDSAPLDCTTQHPLARWATREEIAEAGWAQFIDGEKT